MVAFLHIVGELNVWMKVPMIGAHPLNQRNMVIQAHRDLESNQSSKLMIKKICQLANAKSEKMVATGSDSVMKKSFLKSDGSWERLVRNAQIRTIP
jgi:hypothetical protein